MANTLSIEFPGPNLAFRNPNMGNLSESQNTFPPLGEKKMKLFPKGVTAFLAAPSHFPGLRNDV